MPHSVDMQGKAGQCCRRASSVGGVIVLLAAVAAVSGAARPRPATVTAETNCTGSGCHQSYLQRKTLHAPVKEGACLGCHAIADAGKHLFRLPAKGSGLCMKTCHEKTAGKMAGFTFLHGPVAAGACTVCHDPHGSERGKLLRAEPPGLCLKCHTDVQKRLATLKYKHTIAVEGCVDCHDPHGGRDRFALSEAMPELCTQCHDEIGETAGKATVKHTPVTTGKACAHCHDAHAAAVDHLLSDEQMPLCLSCHNARQAKADGAIPALNCLLTTDPRYHGPLQDGDCTSCHGSIHGGNRFRLLSEDYPARFYTAYEEDNYALCFLCHESDIARDAKTSSLTGFRNGDRNLHFLHVNRKKGRTCRACHQPHASTRAFHIRESVPFGEMNWALPVNFRKTATGGSCLPGCHRQYAYDRESPVVNVPPAD